MSIKAEWTTTCSGCGKVEKYSIELTEETSSGLGWYDIWGPGWPEGWLQVPYDEITDRSYLFFHNRDCYKDWLRKQGRLKEVEEFENGIWIA